MDINLLVALDALLSEGSVSRAAQAMNISQPAMSQTLGRLRDAFDDPLLIRAGRGMVPSALAESLELPLRGLLAQLEVLVSERGRFEPGTSRRTFRISCLDHYSGLHLPGLMQGLERVAPHVDVVATPLGYDGLAERLQRGDIDLGIGVFLDSADLFQAKLHDEEFACILRAGHPALEDWGPESFVRYPHGLISTTGRGKGAVDRVLEPLGLARRVGLRVPHFMATGPVAQSSDLIFTVARRLAAWLTATYDVVLRPPPVELPGYTIAMRWHRRVHDDPAHRWFRDQVRQSAA